MNWTHSLVTKITALTLILVILISGIAVVLTYDSSRNAMRALFQDELKTSAGIMATRINTTDLLSLDPGDEGSPAYVALAEELTDMRSANSYFTNAYILRVDENQNITFIVDDFWLEDPLQAAYIGEVYDSPDRHQIFGALSVPTASDDVYTDKWGTFVSGYAPVRDHNGDTVAVLGIDVEASRLTGKTQGLLGNMIIVIVISLIIGGGVVFLYTRALTRDINRLADGVRAIQEGERTIEFDTKRHDEIGELSRAIADMEAHMRK